MGHRGEDSVATSATASVGLTFWIFTERPKPAWKQGADRSPRLQLELTPKEQGSTPMNQIALMLALGATSGLFGRSKVQTTCPNGNCAQQYVAAPAATYAPKYGQPVAPAYNSYYYAPRQAAPVAAPVAAPAQAARPTYYYYPAQPSATCPTGTCPYRR
jgi:hypothetical protein